ncbi:MAG TPA: discoidin domain-containing protein [Pyrinomonadaceae bacterium]|nr:discoidin domain-containing protein [Pyrinomonadaceae bacterium]
MTVSMRFTGMSLRSFIITIVLLAARSISAQIDLSGEWRFALDPTNAGVTQNWYDQSLREKIKLPGILQSQGYGDEISTKTPWVLSLYDRNWFEREDYKAYTKPGNVKVPFLSQPPRHYIGPAWYQRDIEIPADWRGKRIVLYLERPRWESTVWIDGKKIGSARSLVAPHEFDLGKLEPGKHRLTVRVDTTMIMPYRPDAHSVSDSLGMSWNGIVGKMELRATKKVWIEDVQIYEVYRNPGLYDDADSPFSNIKVKVKIKNSTGKPGTGYLSLNGRSQFVVWSPDGSEIDLHITIPKTQRWDEFNPKLHKLLLTLKGEDADESREISYGVRTIKAVGKEFQLNGRRIYLRGTHHGGDFPLTGYPPTDVAYWRKIFQINKDWGINHVRFHSFCPPEAAFQAADELGIYLQPEPGMWNEVSPGTPMEKMLYEETEAMIKAYGNHPSFLLFSPGNEPKGRWKEAFDKWITHYRLADPRRIYTNGTGHTEPSVPGLAEGTDYLAMQRIGQKMLRGNTAWFGKDYGASLEDINVPVVSHELGQWVAYPDYSIIKKFTGYMRPGNYEIFRDSLAAKGLLAKNNDFAYASGRYQLECYKEEIEANLRTPGMDGYQLLDLHDYLGQGTALVGILDAFWEEKGYATAKEFRRFNNETVPLARFAKRVYTNDETITADVEIAHFGKAPIAKASPYWRITDSMGKVIATGDLPSLAIPIGKNIPLGKINFDPSKITEPKNLKVTVGLKGTTIENDWDLWVYPAKRSNTAVSGILITHDWAEAEASLEKGGKVLYMPRKADLDWTSPPLDWVPVFWNRLMNPAWGRMLGLWIDKAHPALAGFPTESYFDWQWSGIVNGSRAMNLDKLPKELQPIVQPIDDWNRNYKLGLVFEAKVGSGKLLVATPDLENSLSQRIAARQLRRSLLDYMATAKFDPKVAVTAANFREVFFDTRIMKRLAASTADVASGPNPASSVIDGDPNTFWLAGDPRGAARQDQSLQIRFLRPIQFSGLVVMPRQNGREHEGDVREYLIQISDDGTNWRDVKRDSLVSTFNPQRIDLGQNVTAKFIKFTSLSGFGSDKISAIAELAVIYTGPKLPDDNIDTQYTRLRSASPDIDEGNPSQNRLR